MLIFTRQAAERDAAAQLKAEGARAETLQEQLSEAMHRIDTLLADAEDGRRAAAERSSSSDQLEEQLAEAMQRVDRLLVDAEEARRAADAAAEQAATAEAALRCASACRSVAPQAP